MTFITRIALKSIFFVVASFLTFALPPVCISGSQVNVIFPEKVSAQDSFKRYKASGQFSFTYPRSWEIVEDTAKSDSTKTILFSKKGDSHPLLGTVSMRVTLSNSMFRYLVQTRQNPSFIQRQKEFINSPKSSGLTVTNQGKINGYRYIRLEGDQYQRFYNLKNINFLIEYSDQFDLLIETAIVDQLEVGNKQVIKTDQESYANYTQDVNGIVKSLKLSKLNN